MTTETAAADSVFPYNGGDDFWTSYVKGRPRIPHSYFAKIFAYHEKHGGKLDVAHEIGAGAGIHTPRLLEKFQRVIVSDPYEANITTAEQRLKSYGTQCTFKVSGVEDTIKTIPAASVDLVFGQAMWHFVQPKEAITAIAHQLKPGGTVAISTVGAAVIKDPKIWDAWTRLTRTGTQELVDKEGNKDGLFRRVTTILVSKLDAVPLPTEYFNPGGLRIAMKEPLGPDRNHVRELLIPSSLSELQPWSEVGETDVFDYQEETAEWAFEADYQTLIDIYETYFVDPDSDSETQKRLKQELRDLMGDSKTKGVWTYSLVLATRRVDNVS